MGTKAFRQQNDLKATLEEAGWSFREETTDGDWWCDATWSLESNWNPVGREAFLSFVVDPMEYAPNRPRWQAIWRIGVSPTFPETGSEITHDVYLESWAEAKKELIRMLGELRGG